LVDWQQCGQEQEGSRDQERGSRPLDSQARKCNSVEEHNGNAGERSYVNGDYLGTENKDRADVRCEERSDSIEMKTSEDGIEIMRPFCDVI
jgi:hypothetical protein